MSTTWTPEVGPKTIPRVVEERVLTGLLNPLPEGTHIRATLGQTVIVGRVGPRDTNHVLIDVELDRPTDAEGYVSFLDGYSLWIASGWTFEILDDEAPA